MPDDIGDGGQVMPITRMNHAVLYVRDAPTTERFYRDVLGFTTVVDHPDGAFAFMRAPGVRQPPRHRLLHRRQRRGQRSRPPHGRHVPHRLGGADAGRARAMRDRLQQAGALVGASDHGANKSLYANDPDGLEFEVMWLVPPEHWGDAEHEAIIDPLDLDAEIAHFADRSDSHERGRPASTRSHAAPFVAEIRLRLADAIHTGQLAPGTPLPAERVLCEEFGVARTSVREAIQGLVIAGYLERRGNRSVVAEHLPEVNFAGDDRKALVTQLFEVRQVIEPAIAELATRRATDAERAEIARIAARSTRDLAEFRDLDRQFHSALAGRAATRCSTRCTPRCSPRCSARASSRRCCTPR